MPQPRRCTASVAAARHAVGEELSYRTLLENCMFLTDSCGDTVAVYLLDGAASQAQTSSVK